MATINGCPVDRVDTLQSIELAEGVEIHLRAAGPYVRVLAYLIDLLIRIGVCVVAYFLIMLFSLIVGGNVAQGLSMLIMFVLYMT